MFNLWVHQRIHEVIQPQPSTKDLPLEAKPLLMNKFYDLCLTKHVCRSHQVYMVCQ